MYINVYAFTTNTLTNKHAHARACMHSHTGVRTEDAQKMFQLSFDLRFNEAEWSAKIEGESNRSIAQLKCCHVSTIIIIAETLAVDSSTSGDIKSLTHHTDNALLFNWRHFKDKLIAQCLD